MLSDSMLQKLKLLIDENQIEDLRNLIAEIDIYDVSEGLLFNDQTIFMYACKNGTPEAVKCFLDMNVAFYELKYGDSTEFKCAAANENHALEVLSLLLKDLDKEFAKEMLESNGDPYSELEGEGDGKSTVDILRAKGDSKSLELVKKYLE